MIGIKTLRIGDRLSLTLYTTKAGGDLQPMSKVRKSRAWKIRHQREGEVLLNQRNRTLAEEWSMTHTSKVKDKEFDLISKVEVLFKQTQHDFCYRWVGQDKDRTGAKWRPV